jgi:hypothetical protein
LKLPLNLDLLRIARIIDCDRNAKDPYLAVARIDAACAEFLTQGESLRARRVVISGCVLHLRIL